MELKWPGFQYQAGRAAPKGLASRHCLSKFSMLGPEAYTHHKHGARGMGGAKIPSRWGSWNLGSLHGCVSPKEAIMFLLPGAFSQSVWRHHVAAGAHVPYTRHTLPLSFLKLLPFSFSANTEPPQSCLLLPCNLKQFLFPTLYLLWDQPFVSLIA